MLKKLKFLFSHYIKRPLYEKYVILNYDKKRDLLIQYKEKGSYEIFIETGTFFGDTVNTMKSIFNKVYSIELQKDLADAAIKRFVNDGNVIILSGDSSLLLKNILESTTLPSLFWLDAHYSSEFYIGEKFIQTAKGKKETPILEELDVILQKGLGENTILIDDARYFKGTNDYPSLKELIAFLQKHNIKKHQVRVKNDIIRITPDSKNP